MSDNEDKINENYVEATLNLYKKITREQTRQRIIFRTGMLKTLRNDFKSGKITERTFDKAKNELTWAMAKDDIELKKEEKEIIEKYLMYDSEIIESDEKDGKNYRIVNFRKKLCIRPKEMQKKELKTDDIIKIINSHNAQKKKFRNNRGER